MALRALQNIGLTVQLGLAAFAAYNATQRLLSRPTAMASPGFPQRHLDATTGREVVYCYGCENEWYRDDYPHLDLECPRCHNDFVQIVEPDNDPRPNVQQRQQGPRSDSDPDEADIDEFFERGPGSFFMQRSVYHSPDSPFQSPFNRPSGDGGEGLNSGPDRSRTRPDDSGEAVLSRFADMFVELGGARPGQQGGGNAFGTQPRIQRTTFTRSGDGVASFTFTTTTTAGGAAGDGPEVPTFDTLFRGLFSNMPPAGGEDPGGGPGQGGGQRGPPLGFAAGLQEFIATLLNPQAAVHGDAVYTQEALDRIITTLMEANPQSNAAPPATQAAIEKLPKRILDDQMVGPEGRAECTICIDDMFKGEEATVLPCKHWFHGECVTLWLKEHNTCPICRMPIEGNNASGSNNNNQPSDSRQESSTSSASTFASSPAPGRNPFESLNPSGSSSQSASERLRRNEQEREERFERIRNVAGVRRTDSQTEGITRRTSHSPPSRENSSFNIRSRVRDPSPPRDRGTSTAWQNASSSGNSQSNVSSRYGLGSLWGRSNSHNSGEGSSSRNRETEGGQREGGGGQQQQQNQMQQQQSSSSGNGALGWLRDHFGRGSSGSGSGADRDRERRR